MEGLRAPFGTWKSSITAESITKGANAVVDIIVDSVTTDIYYLESRPSEKGRNVLVKGLTTQTDIVGSQWNVRTRVHEYGGGGAIVYNGVAYFCNESDGRIYRRIVWHDSSETVAITPENKPYRYACLERVPHNHREILIAVLEDHTSDMPSQVVNTIIAIDPTQKTIHTLLSGADFYALPKISPDGKRLAWLQWSHPDMPWEGGELYVAEVSIHEDDTLSIHNTVHIAGIKGKVSASYPSWVNNDTLVYTSDESGYVNPWKYTVSQGNSLPLFPEPVPEDFGSPLWQFHFSPYCILGKDGLFSSLKNGRAALYIVDIETQSKPRRISTPLMDFAVVDNFQAIPSQSTGLFIGQTSNTTKSIILLRRTSTGIDFSTLQGGEVLKVGGKSLPPEYISEPKPITLKVPPSESTLHVVYYPPRNPAYIGTSIEGEKPPCIVNVHGGPTGLIGQGLNVTAQYFTSRGWAWLDVNYSGSSGYGRKYIERLNGNWGIADVHDCILAPQILAAAPYNLVDKNRLLIRGGSAGGFTTLAALSIAPDVKVFAAATSLYGVSDLKKFTEVTHKFESHYLDHLMGGNVNEVPEVYNDRSPINHADKIVTPLLILQGDIDKVVPKDQAEMIYKSILDRGGVVDYKLYPGEGHGWRQAETMRDAYERELAFYERVLGLKP